MLFISLFLGELIFLFFVSKFLTRLLSEFFLKVTKSMHTTIQLLSFLFLPGVIVHELSHALFAGILFVRVEEIEFAPRIIKDLKSQGVKLGSVSIAKTDPLRRLIIGSAPVFAGLAFILSAAYYLFDNNLTILTIPAIKVILFYLLFAVSNTMFSSKKDLEGALIFVLFTIVIFALLYIAGFRFDFNSLSFIFSKQILDLIKKADLLLAIPLVLDAALFIVVKAIFRLSR